MDLYTSLPSTSKGSNYTRWTLDCVSIHAKSCCINYMSFRKLNECSTLQKPQARLAKSSKLQKHPAHLFPHASSLLVFLNRRRAENEYHGHTSRPLLESVLVYASMLCTTGAFFNRVFCHLRWWVAWDSHWPPVRFFFRLTESNELESFALNLIHVTCPWIWVAPHHLLFKERFLSHFCTHTICRIQWGLLKSSYCNAADCHKPIWWSRKPNRQRCNVVTGTVSPNLKD